MIFCLAPFCEEGRVLGVSQFSNAYIGQELRCVIDLGSEIYNSQGLETGLNYKLLREFTAANRCNLTIIPAKKDANYLDSLRLGVADLVITRSNDLEGLTALNRFNDNFLWVMADNCNQKSNQLNYWIALSEACGHIQELNELYSDRFNPIKKAQKGHRSSVISPYDDIIRKHAQTLGWDWRMVAAVVYQESKFSIGSHSPRGAEGLMQVMPGTGRYYGVDNLLDPEQNIYAGTSHLNRLQKIFRRRGLEHNELIKFTLAAYNAGEGRILDCMSLAESEGYDSGYWNDIVKVIPLMRDDSILENEHVRLGKFQGHETINYIENVMSYYEAICQICPTSF